MGKSTCSKLRSMIVMSLEPVVMDSARHALSTSGNLPSSRHSIFLGNAFPSFWCLDGNARPFRHFRAQVIGESRQMGIQKVHLYTCTHIAAESAISGHQILYQFLIVLSFLVAQKVPDHLSERDEGRRNTVQRRCTAQKTGTNGVTWRLWPLSGLRTIIRAF